MYKMAYVLSWYTMTSLTGVAAAFLFNGNEANPCDQTTSLPNENIRYLHYKPDTSGDEPSLCDKVTIPASGRWFKVDQDIPFDRPEVGSCGTVHPVWIHDAFHPNESGIFSAQACVQAKNGSCLELLDVKKKACHGYNVYFLSPPSVCPAAYCFGVGVKVHWFINNKQIYVSKSVQVLDVNSTQLNEDVLNFSHLGVEISCAFRLKNSQFGTPSPMSLQSDPFYAGLQVVNRSEVILKEDIGNVYLRSTVPIGCIYSNVADSNASRCNLYVEVDSSHQCPGNSSQLPTIRNGRFICGITISNTAWNLPTPIRVLLQNRSLNTVGIHRFRLILSTLPLPSSSLWTKHPRLNIDIWSIKRRLSCHSSSGLSGKEVVRAGSYSLYSTVILGQALQVQMKLCKERYWYWYSRSLYLWSVCEIALRHGSEFIAMRIANGILHSTESNKLRKLLSVRRQTNEYVQINFREAGIVAEIFLLATPYTLLGHLMNISLSIPDVSVLTSNAKGLCIQHNKNTVQVTTADLLVGQYRVPSSKDIFRMAEKKTTNNTSIPSTSNDRSCQMSSNMIRYSGCVCSATVSGNDLSNEVLCAF